MPKVYIASAFRRFSKRASAEQEYGEIRDAEYIDFLEKIEEVFLEYGFDTCLPHRDEGMWGKVYYDPGAISALCYRHVRTSDLIFALAESGRGVHLELGYAAGLGGKRMLLMHRNDQEPSTLLRGFSEDSSIWESIPKGICPATTVPYANASELLVKLRKWLLDDLQSSSKELASASRANIGLLDVGSHTVKLKVISCRRGGHSRTLHTDRHSLGIMGDVLKSGVFTDATIDSVVDLIGTWRADCARLNCHNIVVTGTAAIRKAQNAQRLIDAIKSKTSLELRVLSPKQELNYVYQGVKAEFRAGSHIAVLNLGGGSTQLGVGCEHNPEAEYFLPFGTRELIERWPWKQPMSSSTYRELLHYVRAKILELVRAQPERHVCPERLVHTGGELDFLLRCRVPMVVSNLSTTHVSEISLRDFSRFSEAFSQLSCDQVASEFGLDPGWVVGAVASNVIALAFAETIGTPAIVPSNLNVADGLVREALQNAKTGLGSQ